RTGTDRPPSTPRCGRVGPGGTAVRCSLHVPVSGVGRPLHRRGRAGRPDRGGGGDVGGVVGTVLGPAPAPLRNDKRNGRDRRATGRGTTRRRGAHGSAGASSARRSAAAAGRS